MARNRSRRYRTRSRSHRMKGGSYSSASTYGMHVAGSGNQQYDRVFDQSGAYGKIQGNSFIGAQGQGVIPSSQIPTGDQLALIQKAGRRRRRGGFFGEVVNQAVVPLAILGMQQTYRRKRGGKRHTRRH